MPGYRDRPPDLVDMMRQLAARVAELEGRALNRIAAGREFSEATGEVSTTLASPADLGGPSVTISVPAGAFVDVVVELDVKISTGVETAHIWLYEPTDFPSGIAILAGTNTVYETRRSVPGLVFGTTDLGGRMSVGRPTAGTRTYSLRYSATGGATGTFRNRRLWVEVF